MSRRTKATQGRRRSFSRSACRLRRTSTVTLNFATADGSAKSVEDYAALSGSLTFSAGQTTKTVTVTVKGDRKTEANEVFYLSLSGAAGAFLTDNQGIGVVRNDDH